MSTWPRVFRPASAAGHLALLVLVLASLAQAQQMPDPSLIHGKALPAPELATGTVTVPEGSSGAGRALP